MAIQIEFENIKLHIMEEVNQKFKELIKELDGKGTEFSRRLKIEVSELREKTKREIEDLLSYTKSKLVSIEQAQALLYNPKDGLMTIALRKVEEAIKFSKDSAECTVEARHAVEKSNANMGKVITIGISTVLSILAMVVTIFVFVANFTTGMQIEITNQKKMISASERKIEQDDENQRQLMTALNAMIKRLEKFQKRGN